MKLPPRWADRFLEWYCNPDLLNDLQGDLYERFHSRVKRRGLFYAKLRFIVDVISFVRPYTLRRTNRTHNQFPINMIPSFYRMAVRMLLKRRLFSIINISGLVLGMTAFVLINIYVFHERSYDNFHVKRDQLFRLKLNSFSNGALDEEGAGVGAAVGPDLKEMFPEIRKYVRLRKNQVMLSYEDAVFRETGVFFASEDFFTLFSIPLMKGVDSLALRNPWTMAVSESMAKKYFGNKDPIGKVMTNSGSERYEVTAVFKDIPENSHLKIDAVFSFGSLELIFGKEKDPYLTDWGWVGYPTYIELDPLADPKVFSTKLEGAVETKMGKDLRSRNQWMSFELQPIQSIHLNSHFSGEIAPNSDSRTVDILALVAALILIMAWVNYISLTTARSLERAKEVGIRKVLGSSRMQLVQQFLSESFLYNLVAFVLTIALVTLVLPQFGRLVGRSFHVTELMNLDNLNLMLLLFLAGVLCSGLYPAFVISSYSPARVLKGAFKSSTAGNILRKGLVAIQFATAVVLISGSLVVDRQLDHMQKSPVGVDLKQILVVEAPIVTDSLYNMRVQALKNEIMLYPGVESVTASSAVPGRSPRSGSNVSLQQQGPTGSKSFNVMYVDYDFVSTFGLEIGAGRDFSRDYKEERSVLLNETGVHILGITDPKKAIGEKVLVYGELVTIVGVVKDYNYESMRDRIAPAVYLCETTVLGFYADFYSFRIRNPESTSRLVELAEVNFKKQFPGNEFIYFFLDDLYNQQYRSEQQFAKAFGLFTMIGIFIACLGLYGLSSYLVLLRAKEIGIRKVFGASTRQIAIMISRQFVIVVLFANVVAWPFAWWLSSNWLSGYASRIDLSLMFFLIPAVVVVIIAISTVATHAVRAAYSNPVTVIGEN